MINKDLISNEINYRLPYSRGTALFVVILVGVIT